eukprot:2095328-Amphidinium_carterae.1
MAQPFFLKPGGEPLVLLTRLVSYIVIEVGKRLYGQGGSGEVGKPFPVRRFADREPSVPELFACEREVVKPFPGRRCEVITPTVPELSARSGVQIGFGDLKTSKE